MSPIGIHDYDTAEPKTYRERKARQVRGTFWESLGFYMEVKCYRSALFAMIAGFFICGYLVGNVGTHIPVLVLGFGCLFVFVAAFFVASIIDCWLMIEQELWHWNKGICRSTGKPWVQTFVGTYYYRSVCHRSGESTIWLIFIEPED